MCTPYHKLRKTWEKQGCHGNKTTTISIQNKDFNNITSKRREVGENGSRESTQKIQKEGITYRNLEINIYIYRNKS
jgi:hypothetical protein